MLGNAAYLALFPHYATLDEIWLAGGGAKSKEMPQMLADIVSHPVNIAETTEMAGRGAAISALIGLGKLGSTCDAPRPTIARSFTPNPAMQDYYQQKLAIMNEILLAGDSRHKRLATIKLPV